MEITEKYLSLEECKDNGLYEIDARNFSFGVYVKDKQGFKGIRHKFTSVFIDVEFHWDTGAPYGTVKPIKFIEMCPQEISKDDKKLMEWLEDNIYDKEEK